MLSTIGVYQQHVMCGVSARCVRTNHMFIKGGKLESLWL